MIDTSDPIGIESLLTAEEIALRDDVGSFVDTAIKPNIAHWHEDAVFLLAIVPEMARLGLLSMHLKGYGCPGRSAVEYGLAPWNWKSETPACAPSSASSGHWP